MLNKLLASLNSKSKRIKPRVIVIFFVTLSLCFLLVFAMVLNRCNVERLKMERLILEKSIKINDSISKLIYKTQMISAFILKNNGEVDNFEDIAATIIDDPSILNILVAPDGVVSKVYPLEGNEAVIGHDFLSEGVGNGEAILAKETGQLVLGGPFNAVQGGQVLVGRLPVFINEPDGEERFWGLVSVTLKYPQALDGAGLNELQLQGFVYEIWRINPDDNERQIIASSGHAYNKYANYVERQLLISNSEWYFRILPLRDWYDFPETWTAILISLCISCLISALVQNNQELKTLKEELIKLSNTDPLTGIHNRRHFMDSVGVRMDRIKSLNSESYIILFDLDYFKDINDMHGHQSGDMVLKDISERVAKMMRPHDLFARYGGEEFIIFASEIDKEGAMRFAESIRTGIADTPVKIQKGSIFVTASFGIAPAAPVNELKASIEFADKALYEAKEAGRNKSLFYDDARV